MFVCKMEKLLFFIVVPGGDGNGHGQHERRLPDALGRVHGGGRAAGLVRQQGHVEALGGVRNRGELVRA